MARSRTNSLRNGLLTLSLLAGLVVAGISLVQQQGFRFPDLSQFGQTSRLPPARTAETLTVASFNIQTFGHTKLEKPQVMDVLAKTIRQFDVVAVQEIRDLHTDVLPRFLRAINADGSHYDYLLGPALGRTTSKERYAFIYDATRVTPDRDWIFTVDDPRDLFHREPLVARFVTRQRQPFTFTLVNIHTDPDEAQAEVNVLASVLKGLQQDESQEDDVIVLGDLNLDPARFDRLARLPGVSWAIQGQPTNTRLTRTYDNLVFDQRLTDEYTGRSGVFDFAREYNLTAEAALAVSDHLPVWAEFRAHESRSARSSGLAANPAERSRR